MTPAPTVVRYEPRGAAVELFTSRDSEIVISGPAGTGKSVACLFRIHLAALNNPGFRGLILRKTAVSLGSTTLVTYKEKVAKAALDQRIVTWYGGSRQEAACYRYHRDGAVSAVIVVGGLDKPEKIMSSEYDLVFVDEATELSLTDWETIGTRLRNGQRAQQQQIAACNPDSEHHWMIQRAQAGTLKMLYSTHRDNPAYVNRDGSYTPAGRTYILGKLSALTGIRRQRLFEGKWTSAEGIVYENWDPAIHLVNQLPKGSETWTRWWTVDFGYSNPFVLQCWAEDPDGRLWLYREIYKTKTLVEDHAKTILRIVRRCAVCCKSKAEDHDCQTCKVCELKWIEPRPRAVICDHDAEDRATLDRHLGLGTSKAHKTVKDGVQAVQSRLKVQGDGRPRLYIVRNAVVEIDKELEAAKLPLCTEQEITGYVWPEGVKPDQRENPVKQDDHGCDAMRYMVAERDLGGRPRVRTLG